MDFVREHISSSNRSKYNIDQALSKFNKQTLVKIWVFDKDTESALMHLHNPKDQGEPHTFAFMYLGKWWHIRAIEDASFDNRGGYINWYIDEMKVPECTPEASEILKSALSAYSKQKPFFEDPDLYKSEVKINKIIFYKTEE